MDRVDFDRKDESWMTLSTCLTVVEIACIESLEIVFITWFRIISKAVEFYFSHAVIRDLGTVFYKQY